MCAYLPSSLSVSFISTKSGGLFPHTAEVIIVTKVIVMPLKFLKKMLADA